MKTIFRRIGLSQEERADQLIADGEAFLKKGTPRYFDAENLFIRAVKLVHGYEKEAELHVRISEIWGSVDPKTEFTQRLTAENLHEAALLTQSPEEKRDLFARAATAFYNIKDRQRVRTHLWEAGMSWSAAADAARSLLEYGKVEVFTKRAKNVFLERARRIFEEKILNL